MQWRMQWPVQSGKPPRWVGRYWKVTLYSVKYTNWYYKYIQYRDVYSIEYTIYKLKFSRQPPHLASPHDVQRMQAKSYKAPLPQSIGTSRQQNHLCPWIAAWYLPSHKTYNGPNLYERHKIPVVLSSSTSASASRCQIKHAYASWILSVKARQSLERMSSQVRIPFPRLQISQMLSKIGPNHTQLSQKKQQPPQISLISLFQPSAEGSQCVPLASNRHLGLGKELWVRKHFGQPKTRLSLWNVWPLESYSAAAVQLHPLGWEVSCRILRDIEMCEIEFIGLGISMSHPVANRNIL